MKIIIVGAGKEGAAVSSQLINDGHDITVIDTNKDVIEELSKTLDVMTIVGNGASPDILRAAGVDTADLLIACSKNDELNTLACVFAKKMGCQNTISRVRTPDYAKQLLFFKEEFGLSLIVNPERYAAEEAFRLLEYPGALKRESFARRRVEIVELVPEEGDPLYEVRLADLKNVIKQNLLVCVVHRGDDVIIPDGNFVTKAGDKLYMCATNTDMAKFFKEYEKKSDRDNIMIIGAGKMAYYLTQMLINIGSNVKVIEIDKDAATQFASLYPQIAVINGDGSSEALLASQHIEQMDGVAVLTGSDEENIVLSLYAKRRGVPQVITKVGHTNFGRMFANSDSLTMVSPKRLSSDAIVSYVRAMEKSRGGVLTSLHSLIMGQVNAMEFNVSEDLKYVGRPLSECKTKEDVLIASIHRHGQIIIPNGNDSLMVGDSVVVVAKTDKVISNLNDIFA